MTAIVNLPGGYWQAAIHFSGAALPRGAACIFGGLVPATGSPTPLTVGTSIKNAFCGATGPFQTGGAFSSAMTVTDVLVKFGPMDVGASGVTSISQSAGSAGGDAEPPNVSLLVQKSTALGGHIGRGRMYVPGLPETAVGNAGLVLAAQVTALQTTFNAALAKLNTDGNPMYLLHRYDPDLGETPRAPDLVTALTVSGQVATTRHRLRR